MPCSICDLHGKISCHAHPCKSPSQTLHKRHEPNRSPQLSLHKHKKFRRVTEALLNPCLLQRHICPSHSWEFPLKLCHMIHLAALHINTDDSPTKKMIVQVMGRSSQCTSTPLLHWGKRSRYRSTSTWPCCNLCSHDNPLWCTYSTSCNQTCMQARAANNPLHQATDQK